MRRSKNSPAPSARGNFTPPPRGAAPAHVPGAEATTAPTSGNRLNPRNWRVPTRLNAILLIPVLVGLVMGGFQVKGSIETWQDAKDAENTARLVRASLTYANALYNERDLSAEPLLQGKGQNDPTVVKVRQETDKAAAEFEQAVKSMPHKPGLERRLKLFREAEPQLRSLRADAYTGKLTGVQTEEGYVQVAHPLMEFANELGLGTGNITSYGRTVYTMSLTKSALSLERSIGMHLLIKPGPDSGNLASQRIALSAYAYLENVALAEYLGGGTQQDADKLEQQQKQIEAKAAETARQAEEKDPDYVAPPSDPQKMVTALATLKTTDASERKALAAKGITPENWWAVNTLKFDAYRTIESEMADNAVEDAAGIASDAQRSAVVTGGVVVIALLAAFILAGLVARQMSRSMRRLRNAAFNVAEQRLPMLVDQLSRTDPGRVDTRVEPIPITTTDEIGEVARAFDQVHREAVRLASEQALLRGNINAIFTNLSRRNQSLIEGQLTLITELENNEADPDQLENLFKLDHLATRMRRNGENLLVLAGEEPGRRWDQPVPLIDVLRAASSEVEQYERIELSGVPEAEIHGRAVTDLVHLLAELLENATTFSSPQTKVRVTATRLPDGRIMVEIHDKGIGLTAEDFADINHKLANPPTVDVAISQRMGLFVVGRLADRHGIRVQLRPSGEQAGTTSLVMLPDAITHGGGGEQQVDSGEFTVSQLIPEQPFAAAESDQLPQRTAAELGFDDSRYAEVPDDIRDLDPVSRSLKREERRTALESQTHGEQTAEQAAGNTAFADEATGTHQAYTDEATGTHQAYADDTTGTHQAYAGDTTGTHQAYTDEATGTHQAYTEEATGAHRAYTGDATSTPQVFDDGQGSYGGQGLGFDQQAASYPEQQPAYEQQAQQGQEQAYYAPDGSVPHSGAYANASYPEQNGYQDQNGYADTGTYGGQGGYTGQGGYAEQNTYPETGRQEAAQQGSEPYADGGAAQRQAYQDDWPQGDGYHNGYAEESAQAGDVNDTERVGFDRPGPAPSVVHELTDAGLPRRGTSAAGANGTRPADQDASAPAADSDGDGGWRSANDERWHQAAQLRKPKAGGVTSSGLPLRVPKANLVEGSATVTPQGGPQVSRAPEDVRGRLSSLHRGVRRGRSAGSEKNGQGFGPDSTYDQER
ncbi:nitrate- and nitrite sensing domain-containing protein [Streptomyces thermoviolaceus]|uniref:sensor histidine kinase n=1 Tax=Streptomyces thermoviolaceus TaxID=1952 RepID=UPI00203B9410|nr:nitrate- and nitrite sensing domain-containing protein [Streptomyces thermoviolaceus]MCM3264417.1 nitrate- and nitrite sensing domain-containing protein [Streptomyces thermoviolaceus]